MRGVFKRSMIDFFLSIVESWSSKLNGWAWRLRWGNRETGTGYKRKYEKKKFNNNGPT
jgi:hypothetical protein